MQPTATASAGTRRPPQAAARRAARVRRRRLRLAVAVCTLGALALLVGLHPLKQAVQEITLPLRHEDIIRQQAARKNLDPALVAAIIYQESKFSDQTSVAGARGVVHNKPDNTPLHPNTYGCSRLPAPGLGIPQIVHPPRHRELG